MEDVPPYTYGLPITFLLSAVVCFADLREGAFIGLEGRRSRYPIHLSASCWAVIAFVGLFGCLVYFLVIKYPELMADTPVARLGTGSWLLASLASGLGAIALIRSKIVPVGDKQLGFEPIYEMAKGAAIDRLVQQMAQGKQKIVEAYSGRFNGDANFVDDLKDYVLNLLATRPEEDREEFKNQLADTATLLAPAAEAGDAEWEQYHRRCIRLAIDFIGNRPMQDWLRGRLPK